MKRETIKSAITLALWAWGIAAFFLMCGEDIPEQPMSNTTFIVTKLLGIASIVGIYKVHGWCKRKGLQS